MISNTSHHTPLKLAVMIGGGGRLKAIEAGTREPGSLSILELVISFKKNSPGLDWAKEAGYKVLSFPWNDWKARGKTRADLDEVTCQALQEHQIDLVVLAGWGLLLSETFLRQFPSRIINVHPALLSERSSEQTVTLQNGSIIPVFRGNRALQEAWEAEVTTTGCTIHYVTAEMDAGPVILKKEVRRHQCDSFQDLVERIHLAEDELLPKAIRLVSLELSRPKPL